MASFGKPKRSGQPLDYLDVRRRRFDDGPARRGVSDYVALTLLIFNLPVVRRSTILAICRTSYDEWNKLAQSDYKGFYRHFKHALERFDTVGWIKLSHINPITKQKSQEVYIQVTSRSKLSEWVLIEADPGEIPGTFLITTKQAALKYRSELASDLVKPDDGFEREIFEQELSALTRLLMTDVPGARRSVSGAVRVVAQYPK